MFKISHDVVTVGGATRDIMFYSNEGILVENPGDILRQKLIGFEYGAKIKPTDLRLVLGGGGCNAAVSFARLGLKTASFIRLGLDRDGDAVQAELVDEKINPRFIERDAKERTGLSFIVIDNASGEHVAFLHRGANDQMLMSQTELRRARTKWFYVSSLSGKYWKRSLQNLTRYLDYHKKIRLAWNPGSTQLASGRTGLSRLLKLTEVLILNQDEATELVLSGNKKNVIKNIWSMAKVLHSWGPNIVVITKGKKGAIVYDGQNRYIEKATSTKRLDTTGAGDAFGSSFVAGLIMYRSNVQRALRLAIVNSGSVVGAIGAQEALLKKKQAIGLINKYYKKDW